MRELNWHRIAFAACTAGILWLLRDLLVYIGGILLGGIIIAALIAPLQRRLERRLPRMASIISTWILLAAIIGVTLLLLIPMLTRQAQFLCEAWSRFCDYMGQNLALPNPAKWSAGEITGMIGKLAGMFVRVGSGVTALIDGFSRFGMMLITSVFLLREKERYLLMAELMIPHRWRRSVLRIGQRLRRELRMFITGQAMVSVCVGALAAIGLMLAGLRSGLLLGLITGLFNLIPYFGPVLAAVPVILVAWMDGWTHALLAGVVLIAVQQIDGFVLSPKIMSSATGLSPLTVLLSISAGGFTFGIFGMVLAIPGAIIVRVLFTELVQNRLKYYG